MYWKDYSKKYPDFSVMVRVVLSIPITTVASKSTFSIGGRILIKYRSSINHKNVQNIDCYLKLIARIHPSSKR